MKIGYSEVYESYRDMVIQSEKVSWNRLNSFLILNSILVLAWATLYTGIPYTGNDNTIWPKIVMTATSGLGFLTGILWCLLGYRGRKYLDSYKKRAKDIEECDKMADWWEKDIPLTYRPFQIEPKIFRRFASKFLLRFIPLVFAAVHVVLVVSTLVP